MGNGARWEELDSLAAQGREVPRDIGGIYCKDVRHAVFLITQPESVQTRCWLLASPDGHREGGFHRGRSKKS
jgi:hypothetical protein